MTLPPGGVGDKGQRYEVRCQGWPDEEPHVERVVGWSETEAGAELLVSSIELHPTMHSPRIIDRGTGGGGW